MLALAIEFSRSDDRPGRDLRARNGRRGLAPSGPNSVPRRARADRDLAFHSLAGVLTEDSAGLVPAN